MDYFRQDSAHFTSSLSVNKPAWSASEDEFTHKRWAKGVLVFYTCLFFAGAIAIGVHQTSSSGTEQHASLQADIRPAH